MKSFLNLAGQIASIMGLLLCLVAGVARLAGAYQVFGFEAMTLFTAGIALMVAACLAKLEVLSMNGD